MRHRMNVYFPPELLKQIADLADRKKLSRSTIVEAAVASFLSPDGADRREAAFVRRLDRLSRRLQKGQSFLHEIPEDIDSHGPAGDTPESEPLDQPGRSREG